MVAIWEKQLGLAPVRARADELVRLACRPLELFQRRGGGSSAGSCELLRRQLRLEPIEGRAGGEGVGRGQLLVTHREREDHDGPLLLRWIFGEARADPAQCKKLERDGLRVAGPLERIVEALARLSAVSERELGKTDAAERRDQPSGSGARL